MERKQVVEIQAEIDALVKNYADKKGYKIFKCNCSYSTGIGSLTLHIGLTVPEKSTEKLKNVTQEMVNSGLAPSGYIVWKKDSYGDYYLARIVSAKTRAPRYVFEWPGEEELGMFSAPFESFLLINPVTKQPAFIK